ncbi:MAG TPA: 16S rRNA (adenine(1518)-N(6)/adenine(1519)-N(6))-dimethyltransferase [Porphyromonadaceae bacterium]|jgi:16S rRNA (adenine1518-N6/adenine1519-N6)-dimethyltransferase|uniref:16S rRNA (adenine(1518)-N(6)/adenine(1519)-N(6))- dimethyltransferase RsmA n=1 Tax=Limibacterium fermenti TaxID=3229863 RepID=UPI000E7EB327|nr:16S rRNA (adenine(1518)-N(6)/adenine(1519)-N(6))-dimethyltransferase [Porphyromonadaceae bacterium]HBK30246.1 16S rRNA (adenine(1518)-N(6)/adenine(1519)-N(6))-dimethyltransferase [Porphyromonadaceae bacterium]HBL35115.1 16S rRNA (adenine(1518)-N(6)/adenine(1519)-N(6))-dimethyltransferase [Porphyromonadaceae bacterium]HBX19303.1 16S rRNA (adenine(1518)-N(6)/adenine(1519)-N(6))-dimethyltransferase [Porphyromonadaceae bacterium]HBX45202.1 16S rRNA (adenine(1518)-N(6)/adenine(1519)-N(6))-dimethy
MISVRPKKNLGQHFLKDEGIAQRIAATLDGFSHLPVLEVGAGTGMLTRFLVGPERDVTVVDIDAESITYLEQNFPMLDGKILRDDFLQMDLSQLYSSPFCVIGNYPYHISSQIIFKVLEYKELVICCSGMLQKEVAERLAAPPGSKTYGILSVLAQAWYDIDYLFTVNEQAFIPPPKVKSGVVRLVRNNRKEMNCDETLFKRVVKTCFNQRRKMLRNSIKSLLPKEHSLPDEPLLDKRPEQLSVEQFEHLTNLLSAL